MLNGGIMKLGKTSQMPYRDWLNLRTHLLWCYDHAIVSDREHGPVHRTSEYVNNGAWLVRSGWAQVRYDDQIFRAQPGQWLIVKPGQRIQSFAVDTHLLSVSFEAAWPDGTNWLETGLPLVIDSHDCPALERKAKPMVRIMAQVSREQWDARQHPVDYRQFLQLERSLNDWFLVLLDVLVAHDVCPRVRANIDERVMKAVNLIDGHPLGEPLDQEALGRQAGLSLVHLTRLFHHHLGTSPRHYFQDRRIDYAYRRLRMSDVRAKEVAFTLGFRHLSHFSKWFKKLSGKSPRNFIKDAATTKRI